MEKRLFALLLFTEVLPLTLSVPRKYFLIQQGKTWNDAQTYCQANYIDLATIDSNENMVEIQNEAKAQKMTSGAWVGLYTNMNSWHWSFGNEPLGSFTGWYYTQPDNSGGNEQCGSIRNYIWDDAGCTWEISFLCFDDTKTGSGRYIFISTAMTWYDAQTYCRQHYTDLASISDAQENSVIGSINTPTFAWTGLTRNTWKWSDQTTNLSMITWPPGSANDYLQNKSCGYFANSLVGSATCSNIMPFYCYLFPTQQQIMKVKVNSNQNVNDRAIMTAILEKIQQKLEDDGTGIITMKWREQPDGVVFYKQE